MNDQSRYDQDQELHDFDASDDVQDFADFADDAELEDDVQANDAEYFDIDGLDDADVFEETSAPVAATNKKKPNWFNIGIAGVAILVAGGLVLSKLLPSMGDSGANTMMAVSQTAGVANDGAQNSEASVQAALMPNASGVNTMGGLLDNPDAFSELAHGANSAPPAAPTIDDDPFLALSQKPVAAPEVQQDAAAEALPMPSPISTGVEEVIVTGALPSVDTPAQDEFWSGFDGSAAPAPVNAAQNPAPIQVEPPQVAEMQVQVTESAPITQVTPPAAVPSAITPPANVAVSAPVQVSGNQADPKLRAEVETLNARLNSLENKIDSALAAAAQVQTQVSKGTDTETSNLKDIENALSRLENRIDDLASAPKAAPAKAKVTQTFEDQPAPAAAPKAVAKKAPAKAAAPKAAVRAKVEDAPYKASAAQASSWRLRGAQPGLAIIAQDNGNVREVRAGDFVPGLGEITGVAQMNGKWVVQGTQGRISQ